MHGLSLWRVRMSVAMTHTEDWMVLMITAHVLQHHAFACSYALYMHTNVLYTLSTALLDEWTPSWTKPPSTVKYIYHLSSPSHDASTAHTCPVNSVSGFFIRCIRKNLQDTGDTREGVHALYWLLLSSPAIPSHVVWAFHPLPTPHM